jgi:hypothetical protein
VRRRISFILNKDINLKNTLERTWERSNGFGGG